MAKSGLFELADLDRLPDVALAVWYARQRQQRADALSSEAMVPAVTVKDAQTVRGRMLRVLEYYFVFDLLDLAPGVVLSDLSKRGTRSASTVLPMRIMCSGGARALARGE